jgi:hypothetical protein
LSHLSLLEKKAVAANRALRTLLFKGFSLHLRPRPNY